MPKQIGTHRVVGTTGNMTYSKTKDGYLAREKTVVNTGRIKTSESYQRVRENNAHFGEAAKGARLIRNAYSDLIKTAADGRMTSRLITGLLQVVNSDATSNRGERKVHKGNVQLVQGFEFNKSTQLPSTLQMPYTVEPDRANGLFTVNLAPFIPEEAVTWPLGATHFRITAAAAELDFENHRMVSDTQMSAAISLNDASATVALSPKVTAQSDFPLFLVLGIRFFMQEHAKLYPLAKGLNALAIVHVDVKP